MPRDAAHRPDDVDHHRVVLEWLIPNPDDPRLLAQFHVTDRQGQPGKWRTLQPDL